MASINGNVAAILTGEPGFRAVVLHAELTSFSHVKFTVPDVIRAVLLQLHVLSGIPTQEGGMHLQIKGVGNFDFDGVADAFHGDLAQGDGLSVGGQHQAIVAILQHLDVSAGIKGIFAASDVLALDNITAVQAVSGTPSSWREANPNIVKLWWDVDRAAMTAVRNKTTTETHGLRFCYESGFLFITLPSGRRLAYVKPRIGENQFGSPAITYEGVGGTKKWERLESYGPKFVENIVQATSRDILCHAMSTLRDFDIVAHVHDELIIEADPEVSLETICQQMGHTPPWCPGLVLRADGYVTPFYKKD